MSRTIAEWGKYARLSRSEQFRRDGASTLLHIVGLAEFNKLTDDEKRQGREAIEGLLVVPELDTRQSAAQALGRLGDPLSATPLIASVKGEKSSNVRAAYYRALGQIKDDAAIPLLSKAVLTERHFSALGQTEPTPPQEAALALGGIGTKAAHAALLELSKKKLPPAVKEAIAAALDKIEMR